MGRSARGLNYRFIIAFLVLAAVVIAAVFVIPSAIRRRNAQFIQLSLYYLETPSGEWRTEPFRIRKTGLSGEQLIDAAVNQLKRIPELVPGSKTLNKELTMEYAIDGETCVVVLPELFYEQSLFDRSVSIGTLVYTLTEFDFIEDVLLSDRVYDRSNILLFSEDLEDNIGTRTYRLYFANQDLTQLVSASQEITIQPNIPLETLLIDELIKGPADKEQARLIPADVRLRGSTIRDGDICYVDFTTDFIARMDSEEMATMVVSSIANTIFENSTTVERVQFLFAGDKTTAVFETLNLDIPLLRGE